MAKPPPQKKKPGRPGGRKKISRRGLWLFFLVLLVTVTFGSFFYLVFLHDAKRWQVKDQLPAQPHAGRPRQETTRPVVPEALPLFEEPTLPPPGASPPPRKIAPKRGAKPLLAIIIDDMGHRPDTGRELLGLKLPLTFAFLPFAPHTESLLAEARAKGHDILLHLPLEAMDGRWNSDPGTLTTAMDPDEIKARLSADLQAVPGAIGINNHMGSLFTADPEAMRGLLAAVREHQGLFFFDSVTSARSVAYQLALEMGIKTNRRQVFLDNDQEPEKIIEQLKLLVQTAEQHGEAVGIGHPYPATVEAIRRYRTELLRQTKVVGISHLVH